MENYIKLAQYYVTVIDDLFAQMQEGVNLKLLGEKVPDLLLKKIKTNRAMKILLEDTGLDQYGKNEFQLYQEGSMYWEIDKSEFSFDFAKQN